jgi:hypothetical protein
MVLRLCSFKRRRQSKVASPARMGSSRRDLRRDSLLFSWYGEQVMGSDEENGI